MKRCHGPLAPRFSLHIFGCSLYLYRSRATPTYRKARFGKSVTTGPGNGEQPDGLLWPGAWEGPICCPATPPLAVGTAGVGGNGMLTRRSRQGEYVVSVIHAASVVSVTSARMSGSRWGSG